MRMVGGTHIVFVIFTLRVAEDMNNLVLEVDLYTAST